MLGQRRRSLPRRRRTSPEPRLPELYAIYLSSPPSLGPAGRLRLTRYNSCGLWALIAGFNVQVYDYSHRQFLERDALHSMGMKIHFTAAVGLDKPVTTLQR